MVSLNDMADRAPRALADGETIEIGQGRRIRYVDTPHTPHGWDAGLLFEETTATLLCSDIFAHTGNPVPMTSGDIFQPAIDTEERTRAISLTAATAPTLRRLAELRPLTLGLMHGSSFNGDAAGALNALAGHFDRQLRSALG